MIVFLKHVFEIKKGEQKSVCFYYKIYFRHHGDKCLLKTIGYGIMSKCLITTKLILIHVNFLGETFGCAQQDSRGFKLLNSDNV